MNISPTCSLCYHTFKDTETVAKLHTDCHTLFHVDCLFKDFQDQINKNQPLMCPLDKTPIKWEGLKETQDYYSEAMFSATILSAGINMLDHMNPNKINPKLKLFSLCILTFGAMIGSSRIIQQSKTRKELLQRDIRDSNHRKFGISITQTKAKL